VHLIWNNYYSNGSLPDHRPKGSFWWKTILKQLNNFKGLSVATLQHGSSILMWHDLWDNKVRSIHMPELFSYTLKPGIYVQHVMELDNLHSIFQLPLSEEAYQQFMTLQSELVNLEPSHANDPWSYIWGSAQFSVHKAYISLSGHSPTHPFNLLWASKCQPKHRVFFWLLLHDKLNTRDRLGRRHMALDSYVCENCILQRREAVYHLFLRCNFARNCWGSIGIASPNIACPQRAVQIIRIRVSSPCAMEIVILMAWSIWNCLESWMLLVQL
jgi:hypothetical protein